MPLVSCLEKSLEGGPLIALLFEERVNSTSTFFFSKTGSWATAQLFRCECSDIQHQNSRNSVNSLNLCLKVHRVVGFFELAL